MNQSAAHSKLINDILLLCGSRKDCRIWKNATGVAFQGDRVIRFGKKDSPDIIGFTSDGKFLGFEGKTGKAVKSKGQKNFHAVALRYGCRIVTVYDARAAQAYLDSLNLTKIELTPDLFT